MIIIHRPLVKVKKLTKIIERKKNSKKESGTLGSRCSEINTKFGDVEYLLVMEAKLREEVKEYTESRTIDELVDILEVVYRIADLKGNKQTGTAWTKRT